MDLGGIRLHGLPGVEDRRKGFVVHLNEGERLLCQVPRSPPRRAQPHPHKADLVTTDDRLVRDHGPEPVSAGDVPGGEDGGHARERFGTLGSDGPDEGVRVRASQDLAVKKPHRPHNRPQTSISRRPWKPHRSSLRTARPQRAQHRASSPAVGGRSGPWSGL